MDHFTTDGLKVKHLGSKGLRSKTPELPISDQACVLVLARAGSGKTTWVMNVIYDFLPSLGKEMHNILHSTNKLTAKSDPLYRDKPSYGFEEAVEEVKSIKQFEEELAACLHRVYSGSSTCEAADIRFLRDNVDMIGVQQKNVITVDDSSTQSFMKSKTGQLMEFIKLRRHLNTDFYLMTQSFTDCDPDFRKEATDIVLFRDMSKKDLDRVWDELLSMKISKEDFINLYKRNVVYEGDHMLISKNNPDGFFEIVCNLCDHYVFYPAHNE